MKSSILKATPESTIFLINVEAHGLHLFVRVQLPANSETLSVGQTGCSLLNSSDSARMSLCSVIFVYCQRFSIGTLNGTHTPEIEFRHVRCIYRVWASWVTRWKSIRYSNSSIFIAAWPDADSPRHTRQSQNNSPRCDSDEISIENIHRIPYMLFRAYESVQGYIY